MEKLLLFGTGRFYQRRREKLYAMLGQDEIVGFLDNRAEEKRIVDGRPVYLPGELSGISYDRIILMSASIREMREQLLQRGVSAARISFYEEYLAAKVAGTVALPIRAASCREKKRILIVAYAMNYDGGTIVAVYAAQALQARGYDVTLTASAIHPDLARDVQAMGVEFVACPTLPYLGDKEREWIGQYDILIVNVFQNIQVACSMRRILPIIWWLHEAGEPYSAIYPHFRYQFSRYDSSTQMGGLQIFGVSPIASRVFSGYYPEVPIGVLPYGIPDTWTHEQARHEIPVFAIIGGIQALKGQRELLQAARVLWRKLRRMPFEVWLIGSESDNAYGREVSDLVQQCPFARFKGILTREKMETAYRSIDVVVCASQEETMSMTCIEGLMHAKVCLTTRNTGIASYLEDGVNGFVCEDNRPEHLADALERIWKARPQWDAIGRRGRMVYEEYFTMDAFGERLEQALLQAESEKA